MKSSRLIVILMTAVMMLAASAVGAARNLDADCNPKDWLSRFQAWWDPQGFWTAQIPRIEQQVEDRIKSYQVYLVRRQTREATAAIERENAREKSRIEQASLEEIRRILGKQIKAIPLESSQRLEQALEKADETLTEVQTRLDETERQSVIRTIHWGERCVEHSRQQSAQKRP